MQRLATTVLALALLASACAHAHQAGAASGSGGAPTASGQDAPTITITRSGSQPYQQGPAEYFTLSKKGDFIMKVLFICSLLVAGLVSASSFGKENPQDRRPDNGPIIKTADGPVRGLTKNGVNVFLGIPYAAPPVGDLRWKPPQPAKRWRGTLDASHYANTCTQVTTFQELKPIRHKAAKSWVFIVEGTAN
jgi:hypothetical protein